ncbi:hypothetical protein KCU91_g17763, partial [Aureobasidium melanogenum]
AADTTSTTFPGSARYDYPFFYLLSNRLFINPPVLTTNDPDTVKQNERHSYEKCQYEEFKKRVAKMDELRAAKGGERSN